jgi:tetratricopeptide (TPR) repeat protein
MTAGDHLTVLESVGLVQLAQAQPDLEYLFRHALVQDAAYSSLVKQDRRQLHGQVGETLERLFPDRLDELAPLLAQHFDESGDSPRALHYYTRAGDRAAQQYANAEAAAHYTRAIDLARSDPHADAALLIHLHVSGGQAWQHVGRYDEAQRTYAALEAVGRERGDKTLELAALMAQATIHSTPSPLFDAHEGEQLSLKTLALARELGDRPAEAKSLWNMTLALTMSGDTLRAIACGEQSLAIARAHGLREQLAFTLTDLAQSYVFGGQLARGLAAIEESIDLWRALGNRPMLANGRANAALYLFSAGRFEDAIAAANEAMHVSRSIGNLWGQAFAHGMLGYPLAETGQLGRAIAAWEESVRLGEPSGLMATLVGIRADLAWLYGALGWIEHGIDLARRAADSALAALPIWRPWTLGVLARLYLLAGEPDRAEPLIREACQKTQPERFNVLLRSGASAIGLAEGELALSRGNYSRVVEVADDLAAHLRSIGAGTFLPDGLLLKGRGLLALNQTGEARTTLREAYAESSAIGSRRTQWAILAASSEVESRLGNSNEADSLRQQAREIVAFLAENIDVPELRASFLSLPDVRNLTAP